MTDYKQVILVRSDLKLTKGKMSAQAAHAAVDATLKSDKDIVKKWRGQGMKKIVVRVESKEELFQYKQKAEDAGLITAVITDAGHTHVAPGTTTCMAIGPSDEEKVDNITRDLKLIS